MSQPTRLSALTHLYKLSQCTVTFDGNVISMKVWINSLLFMIH